MKFSQKIRPYRSPEDAIFSYAREGRYLKFIINFGFGMLRLVIGGPKLIRVRGIKY